MQADLATLFTVTQGRVLVVMRDGQPLAEDQYGGE
jgi:hypothetical protein